MAEPQFIHLSVHSDYSIKDGLAKINQLVNKAVELGMPALALTDFTNFYGLIKFYSTAYNAGIKPIIGADFYIESKLLENDIANLTILAKNNAGYHNLIWLISAAYQKGYSKIGPTIKQEWLITHKEGLLLLSGGCLGDVGKFLLNGNQQLVAKCLDFYETHFHDNYYLELVRTKRPNENSYLKAAIKLAVTKNIPVVATNKVRFIDHDDFSAHEIRVAIHNGYTLVDSKRPKIYSNQQYLRSEREMVKLFADIPEALKNSVEIAKRCNVILRLGEHFLPQFPTNDMKIEDFLIKCAQIGMENRLKYLYPDEDERLKQRSKYHTRLNNELQVINKMGFPGYFLIVMEFIQWSKKNNIPVGPGRGSGAGSLVAYALNITDLNPLEFDLFFERFLNPERISMPDFDIDFCMEKRDQVIDHVTRQYGREAVAQIITFGTMTAKAVIRDVGRVLGYPYVFVNRISKLIPNDSGMTIEQALFTESKLKEIYNNDEEVKLLINMAYKLEGVTRNVSKHSGGVVIAPTKLTDFSPLYYDSDGKNPLTQFDKNDVEYAGLVKFDFLGLKTLTIISLALSMINNRLLKKNLASINIATIPLNDPKCFNLLQRAETTAIFQLESRGMKDLVKRLHPDCFEDMIALVALFRPGPLKSGMVDNFINRKNGREAIYYPDVEWQHKSLQSVLEPTYGIILYQEQVMQIAQMLAGYTLGSADILRRAMCKKKPEEMAKQRSIFKSGAIKNGIDSELSMKIFDLLEKFAGYGFNKSHSVAYALVSYQTLWLKAHYPAEFMAAVMTADMDNTAKVVSLINECWRMGLKVLPPNINKGLYGFHVNENGEIVYGIGAIKGIGGNTIENIINSREKDGDFKGIFDLCTRVGIKKINRRMTERLIFSGAFDHLGTHRASLISSLKDTFLAVEQHNKTENIGQIDMFGTLSIAAPVAIEPINNNSNSYKLPDNRILERERETLGLYLTDHPITVYLSEIKHYTSGLRLKDVNYTYTSNKKLYTVFGLVLMAKIITTKSQTKIGICTLDDSSGHLDLLLFSDVLKKYHHLLKKEQILIATGYINIKFANLNSHSVNQMVVCKLIELSEAREQYVKGIIITLIDEQIDNPLLLTKLHKILKNYCSGTIPIRIYYANAKENPNKFKLVDNCLSLMTVIPTNNLLTELRNLLGIQQVKLEFNSII